MGLLKYIRSKFGKGLVAPVATVQEQPTIVAPEVATNIQTQPKEINTNGNTNQKGKNYKRSGKRGKPRSKGNKVNG